MARFKHCPACGASVRLEYIQRHIRRAHPGEQVDFGLTAEEEAVKQERPKRRGLWRKERLLYPLVALALVVAIVVGAYLAISRPPSTGGQAPDFVLLAANGGTVHLADLRGRVVLLNFMDVDCSHCQTETVNVLVPLHAVYETQVVFLSINVGIIRDPETLDDLVAFKNAYGASWTYLLDDGTVYREYGVGSTPTSIVLNRDHQIVAAHVGETSYDTLASDLDQALGG